MKHRIERDSLGEVEVPNDAYWGATTQRSVDNFRISGLVFQRRFIRALGVVKLACAEANLELGVLSEEKAKAVIQAASEVMEGKLDSHFPVDIFQTGSGTHSNMNVNEVIANRAIEHLGGEKGSKAVHPNDDVNKSQSSNDVIPTAMHVACAEAVEHDLLPALEKLKVALANKAAEFNSVVKTGRTHLMDATPLTLGGEFSTYAAQIGKGIDRLKEASKRLLELPIGGTAVGTGINTPDGFSALVVKNISHITGIRFRENPDKGEGIAAHDTIVELSGVLKTVAVSLTKIANDIRWMASGPTAGLGEITIPANEPGSSIMPGKVNPTQAEAVLMACAQVFGNDTTITFAGAGGNFELNTMKPVMAYNILQSIEILANSVDSFTDKCLLGIAPNTERIKKILEKNLMLVTALAPKIGYDKAAEIAKEAHASSRSLREVALEKTSLSIDVLNKLLDPRKML
ncbi:MAG TPA: class II fumarate hydratase [Euryarchaeota archaeon]|nr:class II fumarate hydratase [Euryarchaeota archaeon]